MALTPDQREKIKQAFEAGTLSDEQKRRAIELLKQERQPEENEFEFRRRTAREQLLSPNEALVDASTGLTGVVESVTLPIVGGLAGLVGAEGAQKASQKVLEQTRRDVQDAARRSPKATVAGQLAGGIGAGVIGAAALGATGVPQALGRSGLAAIKTPLGKEAVRGGILLAILKQLGVGDGSGDQ